MGTQELAVYAPNNGEWQQRTADIRYIDYGDNSPGVAANARQLPKEDHFEVTGIPGAMEKMGWHKSAALLNKWFHYSPKNEAMNSFQKSHGINHDLRTGAYPKDRFDMSSITLNWVLSFNRGSTGHGKHSANYRRQAIQALAHRMRLFRRCTHTVIARESTR